MVAFRWLGVAGIELNLAGYILAIDPFFTRPPLHSLWLGRVQPNRALIAQKMQDCDDILVSHAHYDHLMDVPEIIHNTGAATYGSENTRRLLALLGAPQSQIHRIAIGDELTCGPFYIQVLPAEHLRIPGFRPGPLRDHVHPPLRLRDYRIDHCFCFAIQAQGIRFLVWTSERVEPSSPADVLFLGLTRQKAYTQALLERVRPRVVIPIHWDDQFRPLSKPIRPFYEPPRLAFPPLRRMDMHKFQQMVEQIAPGVRCFLPEIFRSYRFEEFLR